jgi:hypothetical protein
MFGDELSAFESELREELQKLEPSGTFTESVTLEVLLARK